MFGINKLKRRLIDDIHYFKESVKIDVNYKMDLISRRMDVMCHGINNLEANNVIQASANREAHASAKLAESNRADLDKLIEITNNQSEQIRDMLNKINGSDMYLAITTDMLVGRVEKLQEQIDQLGRQNKWMAEQILTMKAAQKPVKKKSTFKPKNEGRGGAKKGQRINSK